jgi:hypothetical protein
VPSGSACGSRPRRFDETVASPPDRVELAAAGSCRSRRAPPRCLKFRPAAARSVFPYRRAAKTYAWESVSTEHLGWAPPDQYRADTQAGSWNLAGRPEWSRRWASGNNPLRKDSASLRNSEGNRRNLRAHNIRPRTLRDHTGHTPIRTRDHRNNCRNTADIHTVRRANRRGCRRRNYSADHKLNHTLRRRRPCTADHTSGYKTDRNTVRTARSIFRRRIVRSRTASVDSRIQPNIQNRSRPKDSNNQGRVSTVPGTSRAQFHKIHNCRIRNRGHNTDQIRTSTKRSAWLRPGSE